MMSRISNLLLGASALVLLGSGAAWADIVIATAGPMTGQYAVFGEQMKHGAELAVKQLTNKPPTANSKGLRFGNYVQGREVIEEEMEAVFSGQKDAKTAMNDAVRRGNEILRKFEAANK